MPTRLITKRVVISVALFLSLAIGISVYAVKVSRRPPLLEIYIFSLKSGRSVFVRTPDDHRIVIDGGGNSNIVRELTKILPFYSRHIDTVIVTGKESKNVSGLIDIVNRYSVDRAYVPGVNTDFKEAATSSDEISYKILLDTLHEHNIPINLTTEDHQIALGTGVSSKILFPTSSTTFSYNKSNLPELAQIITYKQTSFGLFNNISKKEQNFIAENNQDLKVSLAFFMNSLSEDNISTNLFDKLNPSYVVYSKSNNSSGKSSVKTKASSKAAIDILAGILPDKRFNIKEFGSIKIISDGAEIILEKF